MAHVVICTLSGSTFCWWLQLPKLKKLIQCLVKGIFWRLISLYFALRKWLRTFSKVWNALLGLATCFSLYIIDFFGCGNETNSKFWPRGILLQWLRSILVLTQKTKPATFTSCQFAQIIFSLWALYKVQALIAEAIGACCVVNWLTFNCKDLVLRIVHPVGVAKTKTKILTAARWHVALARLFVGKLLGRPF